MEKEECNKGTQAKTKVVPQKVDTGKLTKGTTVPKGNMIKQIKGKQRQMTKEGAKALAVMMTRSRMTRDNLTPAAVAVMENKVQYVGAMTRSRCRTKTTGEEQAMKE